MKTTKNKLIACRAVAEELPPGMRREADMEVLESRLHADPERLREHLQSTIDRFDGQFENLVLGYGQCGNAVIGLSARQSTLVIPRVDDCNALYLGSGGRYRRLLKDEPGTYFLSRGLINSETTFIHEMDTLEEKYGEEKAEQLQKLYLRHYNRLAFVDTGGDGCETYRDFSREAASRFSLEYRELKGDSRLIEAMVSGAWQDTFIRVLPGNAIALSDFTV